MFKDHGWKLRLHNDMKNAELLQLMLSNPGNERNCPFDHLLKIKGDIAEEAAADPKNAEVFHELFVLLKGLLMTADWMASGAQGEDPFHDVERGVVRVGPEFLPDFARAHERKPLNNPDLPAYQGFTRFQTTATRPPGTYSVSLLLEAVRQRRR